MEIRNNCWNMQKTSGDWKLLPKGLSFANWSWRGNPSRSFTLQVKTALYRAWKIKIPLYDLFRFTVLTIWFSSLLPYSWQEDMSWGEPVPKKLLLLLNIQENGTDEPICRAGIDIWMYRVDTVGKGEDGRNWESSIGIYILPCIKSERGNDNLL